MAWNERSLEVLVKVCNFVASVARRMEFQQQPLRDYQTLFLERVTRDSIQVLARDLVDIQGERLPYSLMLLRTCEVILKLVIARLRIVLLLLWELLDSMDPYLLDQDKLKTKSFWESTEIDSAPSELIQTVKAYR